MFHFPVADFLTTSHSKNSISSYLHSIKSYFETNSKIAPIFVTDNSWALIGAVFDAINSCDASIYINWCYEVLIKYPGNESLKKMMKTRLVICSTHYLKNFIKDIRKKSGNNKSLQITVSFAFTLLQDCISIEQFDCYLSDIFNLLNNPEWDQTVENSLRVYI